jgi:hypothetical protein
MAACKTESPAPIDGIALPTRNPRFIGSTSVSSINLSSSASHMDVALRHKYTRASSEAASSGENAARSSDSEVRFELDIAVDENAFAAK